MPSILALETSTEYCSVALLRDGRYFARSLRAGQSHSEHLLAMVREVFEESATGLADCDAIAFGAGPGSFTGLRIACAVAQGLAYGADLPLLPIGGLSAMAEAVRLAPTLSAPFDPGTTVLAALDARMGEIYWSLFEWDGFDWIERCPPALDLPTDLQIAADGEDATRRASWGCGNAFRIFGMELAPKVDRIAEVEVPDALAIARLACRRLERDGARILDAYPAQAAAPLYVRNRIALTTGERAAGGGTIGDVGKRTSRDASPSGSAGLR